MSNALTPYQPVEYNLKDTLELGQVLARSGFFSDSREAAQCVTKILAGKEMGIGPIAAMTGIYIVKGRVTLSANLMAAQIKRSGKYTYAVAEMTNERCELVYYEIRGDVSHEIGRSIFAKADAQLAGLWGSSDPWKKTPRNMLFARAMSNGAKWYCPDVFSGPIYTPDELADGEATYEPPPEPPTTAPAVSSPPASDKQRNYITGLQDKLAWHSEQLAAHADQYNIDLAALTASQASTLIENMKALAEEKPAKGERPLVKRLRELIADCRGAGIAIPELPKPRDMNDDALMDAIASLELEYSKAQQAAEKAEDLF